MTKADIKAEVKAAAMKELTTYLDEMVADIEKECAKSIQAQRQQFVDTMARCRVKLMEFRANKLAEAEAKLDADLAKV